MVVYRLGKLVEWGEKSSGSARKCIVLCTGIFYVRYCNTLKKLGLEVFSKKPKISPVCAPHFTDLPSCIHLKILKN